MPKKRSEANGHDDSGEDLEIPQVGNPGAAAATKDLLAMQKEMFASKEKPEGDDSDDDDGDVTPPAKPPIKDRAAELFDGATKHKRKEKKEAKKTPPAEEDDDDELEVPGFIDFTALEEDEEEGEKKDPPPADDDEEEEEVDDSDDEEDSKKTPPADISKETNIKNLRAMASDFRRERDESKREIRRLNEELKTRPAAEALQTKVATLEARVRELEPFQLVFNLHQHPEFKTRFIDGKKALRSEMETIAKDYDVDVSIIDELASRTSRKERDQILAEHFDSDSARQDVKVALQKYDALNREQAEYEKKPAEILKDLDRQQTEKEFTIQQKRKQHFTKSLNDGWSLAIANAAELPKEEKIFELVEVPGNKKHNEKVVRPTLAHARQLLEVGLGHVEKMIEKKAVVDAGFARWLAMLCQQAAATQMVNGARMSLWNRYDKLQKEQAKQNGYSRPGMSTPNRGSGAGAKGGKKTGRDVAADIFDSVMTETSG